MNPTPLNNRDAVYERSAAPLHICFRADATLDIGMGHVMRCSALASELGARGHKTTLVSRARTLNSLRRSALAFDQLLPIPDSAFPGDAADAKASDAALIDQAADIWILDSYTLDLDWEQEIAQSGARVAVLEDRPWRAHDCDLLIDPSSGLDPLEYQDMVPDDCCVLSGADAALLRPEFISLRRSRGRRSRQQLNEILVFPGGSRQEKLVDALLTGVAQSGLPVKVLVLSPGLSAHCKMRARALFRPRLGRVAFIDFISDPAPLLHRADLVLGCSGGSAWERCCLGAPSLSVIAEPNQYCIAQKLAKLGATVNLGTPSSDLSHAVERSLASLAQDSSSLDRMSVQAFDACDGGGCTRVSEALESLLAVRALASPGDLSSFSSRAGPGMTRTDPLRRRICN